MFQLVIVILVKCIVSSGIFTKLYTSVTLNWDRNEFWNWRIFGDRIGIFVPNKAPEPGCGQVEYAILYTVHDV